ncbi:MAG: radical SAM protein [Deltaproteobacteria bacterium]|nr:radical SAM protein [Deltaproteobacteria bacterium]
MELKVPIPAHDTSSDCARLFFAKANFLVLKLTDYCNLRCRYCHQDALNGEPVLMPMETLRNAVKLILAPSIAPTVYVQFHGGEPLLCSDDFFREVVSWAKQALEKPNRNVKFCIQTNLTKLTAEREKVLCELGISISFSIDGPPEINDTMRGGSRLIIENYRRMRANGTEAGAICLIQPSNWDTIREVLQFFHDEKIWSVRFNVIAPDGRAKELVAANAEKIFQAKKTILDYMLETDGQSVVDASLYNAMRRFARTSGAPSSLQYHGCESLYCQAGRALYSVNPDGHFFCCDRIAEKPAWAMGNVNSPFGEDQRKQAKQKRSLFHSKDEGWAKCEACDARKICEFSCTAYYVDEIDTREAECTYTRKMWGYFLERKEAIFNFIKKGNRPIFIDDKKPISEQPEETWLIKDMAQDAFFNSLSATQVVVSNPHFQCLERAGQYYLYVHDRKKIFEVDEMVASIARFNRTVPASNIEDAMDKKFSKEKVLETIHNIKKLLPELLPSSLI